MQYPFKLVTLTHRVSGERVVAMKFDDVQRKPELEVSQAEAVEMANRIRAKIGRHFDTVCAPDHATSAVTISANRDTGAVMIRVKAKTAGMQAIVMPPEGWIWFADKLDQASQSHLNH